MLGRSLILLQKVLRRGWMYAQRPLFKRCGKNVHLGHASEFSYDCIELGDDVYIGPHAMFMSAIGTIRIGSKVMFGPGVTILGGDHRTNVVGVYMFDVKEKLPENDRDVVIEDDVWIGAHVLILKGVKIGRGAIIGAGSVVVKDIPSYTVYVGSPPMKSWKRWDEATIIEHEKRLMRVQEKEQG